MPPPFTQPLPQIGPRQPQFLPALLGPLLLVTPPSGLAIGLDEVKAHCRVDADITSEDGYLAGLVRDAAEFVESEIWGQRQLVSATYDVPVVYWWEGPLAMPRPPLQSLVSVSYYDSGGSPVALAASNYLTRTPLSAPGTLERAPGVSWPALWADRNYPVTVRITCGYGPSTTIAAAVSAGVQTVTPASMAGIFVGTRLWVGTGASQEQVIVSAVTATTFTVAFAQGHSNLPVPVLPGLPGRARRAILYVVGQWYKTREPLGPGKQMDLTVDRLLAGLGWGSYA